MSDNTSKYIPYNSVSPVVLVNEKCPDYPFLGGTGFFVNFPPYKEVFFVTARHCVYKNEELKGTIYIPKSQDVSCRESLPIKYLLETKYLECDVEYEDVVVCVLDGDRIDISGAVFERALRLPQQDDVDEVMKRIISRNGKLRLVGYPFSSSDLKDEDKQIISGARGMHFEIEDDKKFINRIKIVKSSWGDGDLSGFSGSPVIEFYPISNDIIEAIPVGVLVTQSYFISINVVTNTIANYLVHYCGVEDPSV
ncbi:MAG: hypothetical protein VB958_00495 [Thalassolituus sp.]|uniref:hypothetical protein n=1 Tax=Thalassolituus sp. TaxID=2030822 RepID=UPI003982B14A